MKLIIKIFVRVNTPQKIEEKDDAKMKKLLSTSLILIIAVILGACGEESVQPSKNSGVRQFGRE